MADQVRYSDYTPDRRGVVAGMAGWQLAAVAVLMTGPMVCFALNAWLPLMVSLVLCGIGLVMVLAKIQGRTTMEWLAAAVMYSLGTTMKWTQWRSAVTSGLNQDFQAPDLPGVLTSIVTHDGPAFGAQMQRPCIIQDLARKTWAATAEVVHPGIGLENAASRAALGQGLSQLLETLGATEKVDQLVFTIRVSPDDGAERAAYVAAHEDSAAPPVAVAMSRQMEAVMTPACPRPVTYMTLVCKDRDIARDASRLSPGVEGRARVLHNLMREAESHMTGALNAESVTWLTSPGLASAIRTGFAPGDRVAIKSAQLGALADPAIATDVPMAAAGPMAAEPRVQGYRHDAWHSASFVILLPPDGRPMGALSPIVTLDSTGEGRAMSVFYPVTPPAKAERASEREAGPNGFAKTFNEKLRRDPTAKEQRQQASASGRRHKVAAGRTITRPAAIASITVPVTASLPDAAARLEASIRRAGFVPQRVDFAQDAAFAAAAIPLGVGITAPRTLWSQA